MSGSGGDGVRVNIDADASGFVDSSDKAARAAANLAASLANVTTVGTRFKSAFSGSEPLGGLEAALLKAGVSAEQVAQTVGHAGSSFIGAAAAAKAAAVSFTAFSTDGLGVDRAFRSAAESAEVFSKSLNPTALQRLRALMGDEIPAAFRMTQNATALVIKDLFGIDIAFKSAAESARSFQLKLDPSPLTTLRAAMSATATGANVMVTTIDQAVLAGTGLGASFKSAADSAAAFMATLNPTPVAAFRAAMASVAPGNKVVSTSIDEMIVAATGLGAPLKSAADSAAAFVASLAPTPLRAFRDAMAEADAAITHTQVSINDAIAAATGQDRALKSASDSAEAFSRKLGLTKAPLENLRDLMGIEIPGASVKVVASVNDLIAALITGNGSFKSAADSAAVFSREIVRIPAAQLRAALSSVAAETKVVRTSIQDAITSGTGLGTSFKEAAASAEVFTEALNGTTTPLSKLRALMADEVPDALDKTKSASDRAARGGSMMTMEFIRLGHEAVVGNWTRIPGTLMVVAEYSDTVRTALANLVNSFTTMQFAGVGAVLAVAGAFVIMIERAHAATLAINEATSAATMQGRSPAEARAQMVAFGAQMKDTGIMGATAMTQVASSISQLGELTEVQKSKIAGVGTALFLNWQSDAKKTGQEIGQIFASTSSLDSYLVKEHLLSLEQQQAWAKAATAAEKYDIGIAAITARLGPLNAQIKAAGDEAKLNIAIAQMTPEGGGAVIGKGNFDVPKHLGDFEPGTKQADPQAVADTQAVIDLNKHNTDLLLLKEHLAAAERVLASATAANNAEQIKSATTAKANAVAEIEQWKAIGDASINAKQQADLAQILANRAAQGGAAKAMTEDLHKLTMDFWDAEAAKSGQTDATITREKTAALAARTKLSESQNRVDSEYVQETAQRATAAGNAALTEADRVHKGRQAMTEAATRAELAVYQAAATDMTRIGHAADLERQEMSQRAARLHMMLLKEDASAEAAAAKKSLGDKLSELSTEQAAVHDNFTAVMAIEDRKVALLRAAGSEATKLLNDELSKRLNMIRQHEALVAADRQRDDAKQRSEDSQEIAQNKAMLDEQVAEGQLTKIQAIALERSFAAQKHAIELTALEATLATLGAETEARKQQLRTMGLLKQQWATEDAKLNRAAVLDFKAQWDKIVAPVESAMTQQIGAVLRGNATMGQAVRGFAASVVISYLEMGAKKVFTEVSSQAMATAAHALGFSQRAAIGAAETASGNSDLIVRLGRWIATQLGLTAATGAGATARAGVLTAEQLAAVTATGLTARLSIAAAASVAAAWAFADSASLGPPGLVAAPGVSDGAYAEVMAFQATVPALAVGAWNVPKDMGANLHAGEMVIPASFAEGMRSAGGGGSSQTLNYAPTLNGGGADPASMRAQAGMIKSYMWHATRNGALRLPGR